MGEPDWATVLETIYEEDIYWGEQEEIDENHPVVQEVDMDPQNVQNTLAYLSQTGLIGNVKAGMTADIPRPGKEGEVPITDADRRSGLYLGLTSKGFEVAHDREQNQRSQRINRALVMLTWILATSAMIQAIAPIFTVSGLDQLMFSIIGVALLILAYIGIKYTQHDPIIS
ncbi:hypothetical protein [Halolamina pelagica]|uniref:hypothetical protein n=1 Tax=Halolamina pelagica TaxID=699431 RepID=UPI00118732B5|nr:hypothetical protein [Halolamina pelagica]